MNLKYSFTLESSNIVL